MPTGQLAWLLSYFVIIGPHYVAVPGRFPGLAMEMLSRAVLAHRALESVIYQHVKQCRPFSLFSSQSGEWILYIYSENVSFLLPDKLKIACIRMIFFIVNHPGF